MDTTLAYRDGRERLTALLRSTGPEAGPVVATCCPEWRVQDVVAHLCGIGADILAGNMAGVTTEPWTRAQVDARSARSLAEVLDEWDEIGPQVDTLFAGDEPPAQLVFDLATHEHDIRQALGAPGARHASSTQVALEWALDTWSKAYDRTCPPLRLRAGEVIADAGAEAGVVPDVQLHLGSFEALRALTGRRSAAQLAAYDWGTDPAPWLPGAFTWGPMRPAPTDIVE